MENRGWSWELPARLGVKWLETSMTHFLPRLVSVAIIFSFAGATLADDPCTRPTASELQLLNYHGDVKMPDSLLKAYARFVNAAANPNLPELTRLCLPQSVRITSEPRAKDAADYGQDINIPFLKAAFSKQIQFLRQERDDCFLVRTNSTAMWFIQTRGGEWLIYAYLDKPIE